MSCTFAPIGVIRSEHTRPAETPIQPVFAKGSRGRVEILPEFASGLRDLEGFSHIYLVYVFDRADEVKLIVQPFLDEEERGVFATRAPSRPNPIGLSVVELVGMEGTTLVVDGLDVLDGTPLLDIKPYSARFDRIDGTRNGWQDGIDDETAGERGRRGYREAEAEREVPVESESPAGPRGLSGNAAPQGPATSFGPGADTPVHLACAECDDRVCRKGADCYRAAESIASIYEHLDAVDSTLMRVAAEVEATGYMQWPRAQEIIEFARRARFHHLGIAFCVGLAEEAARYAEMLSRSFEVSSVCCKVCGLAKADLGLVRMREENPSEVMCSPIAQAELLNAAGTELNVAVGLCVGHDALFARHCRAPVTTLVAKDRVLGHNPAAALYSGYWQRKLREV